MGIHKPILYGTIRVDDRIGGRSPWWSAVALAVRSVNPAPARVLKTFRTACVVVAVVAGLVGAVMVVAPGSTDRYFSWPIGPPPLAGLVGAFYLASALIFTMVSRRGDWTACRVVCFGILAFTLPTVVATMKHRELFDWSRWQAVVWVALFVGSPVAFSSILYVLRGRAPSASSPLPLSTRTILGILGPIYALLAAGLLLVPGRLEGASPYALPGLSGRFLGSWSAFLAVVALFLLVRNDHDESRVGLAALFLWPLAAVAATVRSFNDLQPASHRLSYLVAWLGLASLGGGAFAAYAVRAAGGKGASV